MALDGNKLQQAFRDFFNALQPLPMKFEDAGAAWANLYAAYARGAQAGAPPVTLPVPAAIDTAATTLAGALAGAFATAISPTTIKPLLVTAFSAFWPAVGFVGAGAIGVATSPLPTALTKALGDFFTAGDPAADPPQTGTDQADRMASLLDTWTRSVTVVNTIGGVAQQPVNLS